MMTSKDLQLNELRQKEQQAEAKQYALVKEALLARANQAQDNRLPVVVSVVSRAVSQLFTPAKSDDARALRTLQTQE